MIGLDCLGLSVFDLLVGCGDADFGVCFVVVLCFCCVCLLGCWMWFCGYG